MSQHHTAHLAHRGALSFTPLALAAAVLVLSACGGGGAEPPPAVAATAVDTTPPVVTITDNVSVTTATGDVTFTFTFNKDVGTSFTSDDITVTGGTKGAFTRLGGTGATLVVTPTANSNGSIEVSIAAGAFSDASGSVNAAKASSLQAYNTVIPVIQTKVVSFDETTAPSLIGFGGAEDATVVVDPTNAANKVAKIVKSGTAEVWAGTTVSICPNNALVPMPFSATAKTMSARVWSPATGTIVRLKLEDAADATKSVETDATTTVANAWQTVTFNFANQAASTAALNLATTYNKASIFFNFGTSGVAAGGAKTYYLDDLSFVGSTFTVACASAPVVPSATTTTITMDEASAPTLAGFGGAEDASIQADPAGGSNKVARVIKSGTAEVWAGTTVSTLSGNTITPIAFSATNKTITVRVWSPSAGTIVRLKVENASDASKSVETDATTTVANAWQTLSFNFGNPAASTAALDLAVTYNRASIFFNFGTSGAASGGAKTYYFENLAYPTAASSAPSTPAGLPITFDLGSTTYTLTGFGGAEDASVQADPAGGTNKVARVIKSATAELWAGTTVSTGANLSIATLPFSATAKTVTVRVYAPAVGIPVRLKVEDAADPTKSVETEAKTTAANAWQTLTFNFANQAASTAPLNLATTYNKASIFFNFGTTGAAGGGGTWYFDDLTFVP